MHHDRRRDPRAAKRRDIARSVLPSTARKSARDSLTRLRRAQRRRVSAALGAAVAGGARCTCTDAANARPCARCDADIHVDYPLSEHLGVVRARRDHDKLGPLLAWARHEAARLDERDRRVALRAVLPDGVIGWHAMTHLEGDDILPPRTPRWWWSAPRRQWPTLAERLARAAAVLVADGRHGVLNARARGATLAGAAAARALDASETPERFSSIDPGGAAGGDAWIWRPLQGAHDIGAWANDIARTGGVREVLEALEALAGTAPGS